MSPAPLRRVAIIGGGVSGALTAVQLAHREPASTRIVIFERSGREARGLAYATAEPGHLLNVRAANMSAFPDRPGHFEAWLSDHAGDDDISGTAAGDFVPRALYGRYLEDVLRQVCLDDGTGCIGIRHAEIRAIRRTAAGFLVETQGAPPEPFDDVVLAMGNVTANDDASGRIVDTPWSPQAMAGLAPVRPVLIQGTGLTMIDTVIALRRNGFRGPIVALSRRGLLPQVHAPSVPQPTPDIPDSDLRYLSRIVQRLRRDARAAREAGADWRGVVDALRPVMQSLWQRLPLAARKRFLRHVRPFWDIHRHRIAPPIATELQGELAAGTLCVIAGKLVSATRGDDGVTVAYRPRARTAETTLEVQRIICATGIPSLGDTRDPLVSQLIEDGLATLDPLEIGLDVNSEFQVHDAGRTPVAGLWALGPIVRGVFWECTAVPDIRAQAMRLAGLIAERHRRQAITLRQPADAAAS